MSLRAIGPTNNGNGNMATWSTAPQLSQSCGGNVWWDVWSIGMGYRDWDVGVHMAQMGVPMAMTAGASALGVLETEKSCREYQVATLVISLVCLLAYGGVCVYVLYAPRGVQSWQGIGFFFVFLVAVIGTAVLFFCLTVAGFAVASLSPCPPHNKGYVLASAFLSLLSSLSIVCFVSLIDR